MTGFRLPLQRLASIVCGLVMLGVLHLPAYGQIRFSAPVTYKVGANADFPLAVDLDGDGKLDIAVANGQKITVLYGRGDGTFDPPVNYPVGSALEQIIAVDLNNDGKLDLVDFVQGNGTVAVLLNKGNRKFAAPAFYKVGKQPYGVCAGDFNGDGYLDLAVSNDDSDSICVLLNKGNGTFAPAVYYGAGSYPGRILTADFNNDGNLDLAVCNYVSANVILYYGDGTGKFTQGPSYSVGNYAADILLGDFNQDGIKDLVTLNAYASNVSVLFGNGDGTFTSASNYPANSYPEYGAVADLDDDGYPDILVPNGGGNTVSVLRNHGDGTFESPVLLTTQDTDDRSCTVGDFNGDGKPDVAVTSSNQGTISIFLNTSPRPFFRGLISWWPGNGNYNDVVSGNNGTPYGGVSFAPAVIGEGFLFDGFSGRLAVPDADNLKFTDAFALTAWIKVRRFPTSPNGEGQILFRGDDRNGLDPYYIKVDGKGDLVFLISDANDDTTYITAPIKREEFVFVAATFDQGRMSLYENGVLVADTETAITPFRNLDPDANPGLGIGNVQSANYSEYFDGIIDDVKAYNTATPRIVPTTLTLSSTIVKGGTPIQARLTLNDSSIMPVTARFVSSSPTVATPGSITFYAGRYSRVVNVTTSSVTTAHNVTLSATLNGVTVSAQLTVTP